MWDVTRALSITPVSLYTYSRTLSLHPSPRGVEESEAGDLREITLSLCRLTILPCFSIRKINLEERQDGRERICTWELRNHLESLTYKNNNNYPSFVLTMHMVLIIIILQNSKLSLRSCKNVEQRNTCLHI